MFVNPVKVRGKTKIFGIGKNKTGTTSLYKAMKDLGFIVANQRKFELLIDDWAKRDFNRIIRACKSAQFFQDIPFSYPDTCEALDKAFPNSKFILTIRDTPEQWYNSLTKFHAKKWGKNNRIPTKEDLQNAGYIKKGWAWKINRYLYNTPEEDIYCREILIQDYKRYNEGVMNYFKDRPEDLLILNVGEKGAYHKLCNFLNVPALQEEFPWENMT